jgi:hypothetical protein
MFESIIVAGAIISSALAIYTLARKITNDWKQRKKEIVAKRDDNPTMVQGLPRE